MRELCLAVPVRVLTRDGDWGEVESSGTRLRAALHFVPEARPGDWVLVHAGVAIALLDEEEARESLAFLEELSTPHGS